LPDYPRRHRLRERPRLDVESGQIAGVDSQSFASIVVSRLPR
jgi:hypothetical protein